MVSQSALLLKYVGDMWLKNSILVETKETISEAFKVLCEKTFIYYFTAKIGNDWMPLKTGIYLTN